MLHESQEIEFLFNILPKSIAETSINSLPMNVEIDATSLPTNDFSDLLKDFTDIFAADLLEKSYIIGDQLSSFKSHNSSIENTNHKIKKRKNYKWCRKRKIKTGVDDEKIGNLKNFAHSEKNNFTHHGNTLKECFVLLVDIMASHEIHQYYNIKPSYNIFKSYSNNIERKDIPKFEVNKSVCYGFREVISNSASQKDDKDIFKKELTTNRSTSEQNCFQYSKMFNEEIENKLFCMELLRSSCIGVLSNLYNSKNIISLQESYNNLCSYSLLNTVAKNCEPFINDTVAIDTINNNSRPYINKNVKTDCLDKFILNEDNNNNDNLKHFSTNREFKPMVSLTSNKNKKYMFSGLYSKAVDTTKNGFVKDKRDPLYLNLSKPSHALKLDNDRYSDGTLVTGPRNGCKWKPAFT